MEQITDFDQQPRFADWRQIQAKALVTGQVYHGRRQDPRRVPAVGRQHAAAAGRPAVHHNAEERCAASAT
ncbi:MAG: hypothetical protein V9G14_11075 [Cypionkella sp.]